MRLGRTSVRRVLCSSTTDWSPRNKAFVLCSRGGGSASRGAALRSLILLYLMSLLQLRVGLGATKADSAAIASARPRTSRQCGIRSLAEALAGQPGALLLAGAAAGRFLFLMMVAPSAKKKKRAAQRRASHNRIRCVGRNSKTLELLHNTLWCHKLLVSPYVKEGSDQSRGIESAAQP